MNRLRKTKMNKPRLSMKLLWKLHYAALKDERLEEMPSDFFLEKVEGYMKSLKSPTKVK